MNPRSLYRTDDEPDPEEYPIEEDLDFDPPEPPEPESRMENGRRIYEEDFIYSPPERYR